MKIDHLFGEVKITPATILDAIASGSFFARYFDEVEKTGSGSALAKKSYRHENGFTKFFIGSCLADRFNLRAHFWPSDSRMTKSNVHNHRFDFTSRIFSGELDHVEFEPSPNGERYEYYHYSPGSSPCDYVLKHIGKATLREVSRTRFGPGTSYHFASTALHTSDPASCDAVVTFFVEDRSAWTDRCDVYSTRYESADVTLVSQSQNYEQWKAGLASTLSLAGL